MEQALSPSLPTASMNMRQSTGGGCHLDSDVKLFNFSLRRHNNAEQDQTARLVLQQRVEPTLKMLATVRILQCEERCSRGVPASWRGPLRFLA